MAKKRRIPEDAPLMVVKTGRSGRGPGLGPFGDHALEAAGLVAQVAVPGGQQEGVNSAIVLDRAQAAGGQAQAHRTTQGFAHQRHFAQVGDEAAAGLVVGVADVVAKLYTLACNGAAAGHGMLPIK